MERVWSVGGENSLFVAQQMGRKITEMIIRHYGRWVEQAEEKTSIFLYRASDNLMVRAAENRQLQKHPIESLIK